MLKRFLSGVAFVAAFAIISQVPTAGAETQFGTSGSHFDDKGYKRNGTLLFTCCSGTLGALVTVGEVPHILSNKHILAPGNDMTVMVGDNIISPGLIDTSPDICDENDALIAGTLADYVPINFDDTLPPNVVDAAIAKVTVTGTMDSNGVIANIGTVNGTDTATLGTDVMKQGRTTNLTYGVVNLVSVDVEVTYPDDCGDKKGSVAVFTDQIYITGSDFSAGGDSGSLVLTTQPNGDGTGVKAVGLLFAGNKGGTFINPIDDVLGAFGATLVTGTNSGTFKPPIEEDDEKGGPPEGKGKPNQGNAGFDAPGMSIAKAVKEANASDLLELPGVVAVGVGIDTNGEAVIVLHLEGAIASPSIPTELEGVLVHTRVTGPVVAY